MLVAVVMIMKGVVLVAAGVVSVAVSVLFLLVVMVVLVVVVAAAVFPVLLAFVSKKFFITCLSRSRKLSVCNKCQRLMNMKY